MKTAILSDIHANLEALQANLTTLAAEGVDQNVCLGDIVAYNTNPAECIALLRWAGALCIVGNHDRAVTLQTATDEFSDTAIWAVSRRHNQLLPEVVAWLNGLPHRACLGNQLVMVHGALHADKGCDVIQLNNDDQRRLSFEALTKHPSGARLCAFRHTHRVGIYEYCDGVIPTHVGDKGTLCDGFHYLFDTGTVDEPRTAKRRAPRIIFDTTRQSVTVQRVAYDDSIPLFCEDAVGRDQTATLHGHTKAHPLSPRARAAQGRPPRDRASGSSIPDSLGWMEVWLHENNGHNRNGLLA